MNESFRNTTLAMAKIADEVNPRTTYNWVKHYEKFNEDMNEFTETLDATNESIDDDVDEEVDGPDNMLEKIFTEAGIEMMDLLPEIPPKKMEDKVLDEFESRLRQLKS